MFGLFKKAKNKSAEKKYGNITFEKMTFGAYPQTDKKTADPIEWLVLKKENGLALLMSAKIITKYMFDGKTSDYDKSNARAQLNKFYDVAFSDEEKARMVPVYKNDMVTILSKKEAEELLPAPSHRQLPQAFAFDKKVQKYIKKHNQGPLGNWMLRTPSNAYKGMAAIEVVGPDGDIGPVPVNFGYGVAPVIMIKV